MRKMLAVALVAVASVFMFTVPSVIAQGGPCFADFTCDQDVDGDDLTAFLTQFGRNQYNDPCPDCYDSPCPCSTVYICNGTLSPLARWCDQGDGTVKDMTTGLVWLKKADWGGLKPWADCNTWDDAHSRAAQLWDGSPYEADANLSDGSVEGDWRLPTKTELYNLANGTEAVRASSMQLFTGVHASSYCSSTTSAINHFYAWYVKLYTGTGGYSFKSHDYHVWPARGGH